MERWASSGAYPQVAFCCINIDEREGPGIGLRVCKEFGGSHNLKTVVNGYVKDMGDMPRFGQLGCQGFIFADPTGKVIHPSTPALMQFREQAFRWIEHMLKEYFRPTAAVDDKPVFVDSIRVVLKGLVSRPELNGQKGFLAHKANESGRFVVRLQSNGEMVSVKPSNFEEIDNDDDNNNDDDIKPLRDAISCCSDSQVISDSSSSDQTLNDAALRFTSIDSSSGRQVDPITSEVFSVGCPTSTGHEDMDEEHAACATSLDALSVSRSLDQLRKVREVLASHFTHEERSHLTSSSIGISGVQDNEGGGSSVSLSGTEAHIKDHLSMLAKVDEQIQRLTSLCSACSSVDCCCSDVSCAQQQQGCGVGKQVPFSFIYSLVEHFNYHADIYDAVYSRR